VGGKWGSEVEPESPKNGEILMEEKREVRSKHMFPNSTREQEEKELNGGGVIRERRTGRDGRHVNAGEKTGDEVPLRFVKARRRDGKESQNWRITMKDGAT